MECVLLTTNSSSRYLDTAIWSPKPFLLRVLSTRSLANACPEAGSNGRSLIVESVGSPDFHFLRTQRTFWTKLEYYLEQLPNGQIPASRMLALALLFLNLFRNHLRLSLELTL